MIIQQGTSSLAQPGVVIMLDADEMARAIDTYLTAHGVDVFGPRTVRHDGVGISVYVDPSGSVIADGERYTGK